MLRGRKFGELLTSRLSQAVATVAKAKALVTTVRV